MGNDDDHADLGGLIFSYLVYREIRDGRLDAGDVLRFGCLVVLVVAAVLGAVLLLISASVPRYDADPNAYLYVESTPAAAAPGTLAPGTVTSRPTPEPTPTPKPTPRAAPLPGIGQVVRAGGGFTLAVTRVQRWRPSWYHEPGWQLVTAYLRVRMPATKTDCVWGDMFLVSAKGGRDYQGRQEDNRSPDLFACSDYHRRTWTSGWVTFEVRNVDASGLVLTACPGDLFGCEGPRARIQLPRHIAGR